MSQDKKSEREFIVPFRLLRLKPMVGFVKSEEKNVRLLLCQEIILKQGDIVIDARNRENII